MQRRRRKTNSSPTDIRPSVPEPTAGQNEAASVVASRRAKPPRPSSKLGIVLGLLQAAEGASLARLATVTDWQPHTTRAALTGLRKRGYAVTAEKVADADGSKQTVYRIAAELPR